MANRPPMYSYGDPTHAAITARNYQTQTEGRSAQAAAAAQAAQNVPLAQGGVLQSIFSQPASFANSLGQTYAGMAQGLGQIGGGIGSAFGGYATGLGSGYTGYASGIGNVAQAMANERSNLYGANAMAEAARQGALGNIGSAALGAYGSAANSALGAWAQNQTSYNKALSDMAVANQGALSGYGSSRNQALGSLANAYGTAGVGMAAANAVSDLDLTAGFGGGGYPGVDGFTATGPDGSLASGSYGSAPPGSDQFFIRAKKTSDGRGPGPYADTTFRGLNSLRGDLMAGDITGSLTGNYNTGLDRLDAQHYSSRTQPSSMLRDSLAGLMALSNSGYGATAGGMDQFYRTQNDPRMRNNYAPLVQNLTQGWRDTSSQMGAGFGSAMNQLGGLGGSISSGYQNAASQIGGMFNNFRQDARGALRNILNLPETPQEAQARYQVEDMNRQRRQDMFSQLYRNR